MERANMAQRVEQLEKELHLTKHRLIFLEQEQLPRRVASLEPVVQRLENKLDDLGEKFEVGLAEVKEAISSQRSLQKSVVYAVMFLVGFIQLLPYIKELLR